MYLGAVHKLCRLGRGGEGGTPKDDLRRRGEGGGLRKNYVVFLPKAKKNSDGKIAAKICLRFVQSIYLYRDSKGPSINFVVGPAQNGFDM